MVEIVRRFNWTHVAVVYSEGWFYLFEKEKPGFLRFLTSFIGR